MNTPPHPEPSAARLLAYGLPALPLAILTLPFYILVPAFYAQSLALPIAAVGQVLLVVRLMDAASDPLVGCFADKWRPRFGRRRLWIALSAPLVALAAWQIFVPSTRRGPGRPPRMGSGPVRRLDRHRRFPMVPGALNFRAPMPDVTASRPSERRSRWSERCIALAAPAVLPAFGVEGERAVLASFAVALAVLLPMTVLLLVTAVPEPKVRSRVQLDWKQGVAHMAANAPFRRLLAAFLVNGLANGLPATLFLFFVQSRLASPDAAGPLLVLYFVCGIAGVPLWLWLARRSSKHRAWALGMILACAAFAFAPFLGPGDVIAFGAVVVVTGFALGADVVLPASMQADVIEVDAAISGEERAGLYLSVWALATKLALAGAVGIAFPILGAAGFDPAAGLVTATGLTVLAWLYAGTSGAAEGRGHRPDLVIPARRGSAGRCAAVNRGMAGTRNEPHDLTLAAVEPRRLGHHGKIQRVWQEVDRLQHPRHPARKRDLESGPLEPVADAARRIVGRDEKRHRKVVLGRERRAHEPRADHLHGDPLPVETELQARGHVDEGRLGRAVGGRGRQPAIARHGSVDGDLAPAARPHRLAAAARGTWRLRPH